MKKIRPFTPFVILLSLLISCAPASTPTLAPATSTTLPPIETAIPATATPSPAPTYFNQTPPGLEPQVFAPGVVSVEGAVEFAASFSPDGSELYFTRRLDGQKNVILGNSA